MFREQQSVHTAGGSHVTQSGEGSRREDKMRAFYQAYPEEQEFMTHPVPQGAQVTIEIKSACFQNFDVRNYSQR